MSQYLSCDSIVEGGDDEKNDVEGSNFTLLCLSFIENFEINSPLCICIFFRIPDPNAEKPEDW